MYEAIDQAPLPMPSALPQATPPDGLLVIPTNPSLSEPTVDELLHSPAELELGDPVYMPPSGGGEMGEPDGEIVVTGTRIVEVSDNWSVYSFNLFVLYANTYEERLLLHENPLELMEQSPEFNLYTLSHEADCATADGAAVSIGNTIMATDDTYGPSTFTWQSAEYTSIVVQNPDGSYGANDNNIYSRGLEANNSFPLPATATSAVGIIHNHPYTLPDHPIQRYPSAADWASLEKIGAGTGLDRSMWIIDPVGIVREFSYSERDYFESLTDSQRADGVGLEGRERTATCND